MYKNGVSGVWIVLERCVSQAAFFKRSRADNPVHAQLYNLGPDETLTGFQVHFKNKQHRANVEARIKAAGNV